MLALRFSSFSTFKEQRTQVHSEITPATAV